MKIKKLFYCCLVTYFGILQCEKINIYKNMDVKQKVSFDLDALEVPQTSFHFLLPTIGRSSIFRILDSLESQVKSQDYLTVVFDAKDVDGIYDKLCNRLKQFNCHVDVKYEATNLGFWGHGVRNKYNILPGDFILHCDDDNAYLPNAIENMRKICRDKNKLYIFRIKVGKLTIWTNIKIAFGNIDTGAGVVPASLNNLSTWEAFHGGDFAFYKNLAEKIGKSNIVFVGYVIYVWRP